VPSCCHRSLQLRSPRGGMRGTGVFGEISHRFECCLGLTRPQGTCHPVPRIPRSPGGCRQGGEGLGVPPGLCSALGGQAGVGRPLCGARAGRSPANRGVWGGGVEKYIIPVATATSSSCLPQTSEPTQKEPLSSSPLPAWVSPPCRPGVPEHPGAPRSPNASRHPQISHSP